MWSRRSAEGSTSSRLGAELGRVYCTALSPRRKVATVLVLGVAAATSRVRDEPSATSVREEVVRPADEHDDAVLEADEVEEMDREPHHPGREPRQAQPAQVGDRPRTADRRELAA